MLVPRGLRDPDEDLPADFETKRLRGSRAKASCLGDRTFDAGIRVTVVAPGMVPTDANAGRDQRGAISRLTPLGQVSTAADVAGTVLAMACDLTRQTTGAVITVDGGTTMA